MAHRRLLQEVWRLSSLSSTAARSLQASAIGLPALQQSQAAWQVPSLLRQLRSSAADAAAEQQEGEGISSEAGGRQHREPSQHRPGAGRGRHGEAGRPPPRKPRIYVPQHWEQQGWEDLDLPLVRELRGHVDREDAWEAKHAFEAALAPLKEALQRGEDPRAAGLAVPPPYAWKLYFAVLAATNCHAHHMSELIELMVKLRVEPQPACYVIALRQMARQGIGSPAYTTILRMKDRGLTPTLRCFMFAIESCLRCTTPELTYVKRMFDEVAETGLAVHPTQKSELGKLMMHGVRELARFGRFDSALALLEQLEAMGLRVPAFLVADVLHMAVLAGRPKTLLECVRRLEQATSTFQEVPGVGEPVTRPLKVEEGLLLGALEVAAGRGDVELAEATWQLLERSVALPNPPSTGGALAKHLGQVAALERRQGTPV